MTPIDFLANLGVSKDLARPNRYELQIFPPSGLRVDSTTLKSICANCKQAQFPGKSIDAVPFVGGGYLARMMPFAMTYAPINITFYLSSDHKEKTLFEEWQKIAYNETTNTLGYYDDFVGGMEITQLNQKNTRRVSYQIFEAYPAVIAEVQSGNDIENTVSEIIVTMNYRKYERIKNAT